MASTQTTTPHAAIGNMSILAQAKPAIISATNQHQNETNFEFSDRIAQLQEADLQHLKEHEELQQPRRDGQRPTVFEQPKVPAHIEDEQLIRRQNASNQMRQAAVMNAIATQQQTKQRLSATERLALTAKRSVPATQPLGQNGHQPQANQPQGNQALRQHPAQQQQQQLEAPVSVGASWQHQAAAMPQVKSFVNEPNHQAQSSKLSSSTSMPTLETLLAVQRQLQRHTRQNLHPPQLAPIVASKPQDLAQRATPQGQKPVAVSNNNGSKQQETNERYYSRQFPNLTRPTSNPKEQNNYVTSIHDTYDKELPPLPASISPSSYTNTSSSEESQMNSLESQSSPPTSLVSLPPPPPPISSYLQQYDQVTRNQIENQHQQKQQPPCKSSQPQTAPPQPESSSRDCPPPARLPPTKVHPLPTKQHQHHQAPNSNSLTQTTSSQQAPRSKPPPPLAPRPKHLLASSKVSSVDPSEECAFAPPPPPLSNELNLSAAFTNLNLTQPSQAPLPPPPVKFALKPASPLPPQAGGLDEPDCGPLRFPSPPPPELLLDGGFGETDSNKVNSSEPGLEVSSDDDDDDDDDDDENGDDNGDDDDDDDFQCRIPTPPAGAQKSLSFASFQDLSGRRTNLPSPGQLERFFSAITPSGQQQQRALFNSSSFSVPIANQLCRQESERTLLACQSREQPQQQHQHQQLDGQPSAKLDAPQLTVCVGNHDQEADPSGLLSTATSLHRYREDEAVDHRDGRRQQLMMMRGAMTVASSSSPSSSSDGDGHSSNSSSSTSGVPSSIDSPSLKSESLDFNYGQVSGVPLIGGTGNGPAASIMLAEQQRQRQYQQQHAKFMGQRGLDAVDFVGSHRFSAEASARSHDQQQQQQQQQLQQEAFDKFAAISRPLMERLELRRQQLSECMAPPPPRPLTGGQRRNSSSSINSTSTVASASGSVTSATTAATTNKKPSSSNNKLPRPALKQKKCVSFSDRVELVACAEEQCDSHLPNPLLARVLATQIDPSAPSAIRRNQQQQQQQQQRQQRHFNGIAS